MYGKTRTTSLLLSIIVHSFVLLLIIMSFTKVNRSTTSYLHIKAYVYSAPQTTSKPMPLKPKVKSINAMTSSKALQPTTPVTHISDLSPLVWLLHEKIQQAQQYPR